VLANVQARVDGFSSDVDRLTGELSDARAHYSEVSALLAGGVETWTSAALSAHVDAASDRVESASARLTLAQAEQTSAVSDFAVASANLVHATAFASQSAIMADNAAANTAWLAASDILVSAATDSDALAALAANSAGRSAWSGANIARDAASDAFNSAISWATNVSDLTAATSQNILHSARVVAAPDVIQLAQDGLDLALSWQSAVNDMAPGAAMPTETYSQLSEIRVNASNLVVAESNHLSAAASNLADERALVGSAAASAATTAQTLTSATNAMNSASARLSNANTALNTATSNFAGGPTESMIVAEAVRAANNPTAGSFVGEANAEARWEAFVNQYLTADTEVIHVDRWVPREAERERGVALWFQIGANSGQGINVEIGSMSTGTLFGREGANHTSDRRIIDVMDVFGYNVQDGGASNFGHTIAGNAVDSLLEAIDAALATTTRQRSELGAVQNRLEFSIENLDVASENLSAANSRIRDADMAREMMTLTQANVLQQAAISMLAQANQAPQSVLQLLG